jgi:uncharacterized RDD family membrane protein YckC
MSDPPDDRGGLTSGDPLGGDAEPKRHESGLPAYEPPAPDPGYSTGYSSPPPPGALGVAPADAPVLARYTLSGWWARVGAALIDGIIITIGAILIMLAFGAVFSIGFAASEEAGTASLVVGLMLSIVAITIMSFLYAPLMMARTNGKTLGRMAVGIRVVRANGQPMTFGWAMLREVAVKALLFGVLGSLTFGIASLLDVLWPLWDDENRALHDFIVDTRVVRD